MSGSVRLARLQLHIKEVADAITANYSAAGRSKGIEPLNNYLQTLQTQEAKLGGQAPRANGRSRILRVDIKEPEGVD